MSLLKQIALLDDDSDDTSELEGIFFEFPGFKMESEVVPIDRVERLKIIERCRMAQVRGSRRQNEPEFDENKFNKLFSKRVIKSIRKASKAALEHLMICKPGELEKIMGLTEGQKLPAEIPLDREDIEYLYTHSLEYRNHIDDCLSNTEAFNAALKEKREKNLQTTSAGSAT